jgi:Ca2+-dependent lipid-binding protein
VQNNPVKPIWDEKFQFDITSGKEDLQVIVANKDAFATDEVIGKCVITLASLQD